MKEGGKQVNTFDYSSNLKSFSSLICFVLSSRVCRLCSISNSVSCCMKPSFGSTYLFLLVRVSAQSSGSLYVFMRYAIAIVADLLTPMTQWTRTLPFAALAFSMKWNDAANIFDISVDGESRTPSWRYLTPETLCTFSRHSVSMCVMCRLSTTVLLMWIALIS